MALSKKYAVLFYCLAVAPMLSWQQGIPQLVLSEYQVNTPNAQAQVGPINQLLGLLYQQTQQFINELQQAGVPRNTLQTIINIRGNIFNTLQTATRSPQGLMDMLQNLVQNGITPLAQQLAQVKGYASRLSPGGAQILNEFQNAINQALPAISTVAQGLSADFNIVDVVSGLVNAALEVVGALLGTAVQLVGGALEGAMGVIDTAGKAIGETANTLTKSIGSLTKGLGGLGR